MDPEVKIRTEIKHLCASRWGPFLGDSGGPHVPLLLASGIRLYATGELPQLGDRFYALHVPTLDDVDREELVNAPLNLVDNAQDRPDRAPIDTRLM